MTMSGVRRWLDKFLLITDIFRTFEANLLRAAEPERSLDDYNLLPNRILVLIPKRRKT
jgi:hypothetical protein